MNRPRPQTIRRMPMGLGEANPQTQELVAQLGGNNILTNNFAYAYKFPIEGIEQNSQGTFQQTIDLGAGFAVYEISATARYNNTTTPTGLPARSKLIREPQMAGYAAGELIQADIGYMDVFVSQVNRQWYSDPMPLDQVSGDTSKPYILPVPIWLSQKTTVTVTITNNLPALTGQATPIVDVVYSLIGAYMQEPPAGARR